MFHADVTCTTLQVRYFQRLPESVKKLRAVAARMAKIGLVSSVGVVCVLCCVGLNAQAVAPIHAACVGHSASHIVLTASITTCKCI